MARTVKPTFKQWIPGAGRTVGGTPVQGKTRTVGRISVTSYVAGGESLTPSDVGLSTIDYINLNVREEVGDPEAGHVRQAAYSPSQNVFYLFIMGTGAPNEYALGATEEVGFVAEGDSAVDVELL